MGKNSLTQVFHLFLWCLLHSLWLKLGKEKHHTQEVLLYKHKENTKVKILMILTDVGIMTRCCSNGNISGTHTKFIFSFHVQLTPCFF